MNSVRLPQAASALVALFFITSIVGCDEPATETGSARAAPGAVAVSRDLEPQASPVPVDMSKGWCAGHGVPESACTRCNASLIPQFKEGGDWCAEHGLPESQCELCNSGVAAKWAALDPSGQTGKRGEQATKASPGIGPETSSVTVDLSQGWCGEHGVPESVCTRCDAALIREFKAGNDWCPEHGLPESQCMLCNPEVRAKWVALRPPSGPDPESTGADLKLERVPRLLTARNDSLCQVDTLRVRFLDASIVAKAGIQTEPAQPRRISAAIDAPAEVEFDATRVTRVTPRAAGIVREVVTQIGTVVKAGDVLAVIDSPVLGEAESRYIERKQDHLLAKADHERVQTIFDGVQRMLKAVTTDAPLEEIRERLEGVPVGEMKARLLRAHAALQLARAEAAREARLLDKKISSKSDYETAQGALAAAEADFLASREEIAFNTGRDKLAAERGLTVARAALEAAERRLHILGLDDEQVLTIGSEPDTQLSRHELRSPVSGRVVERRVSAGEAVDAADVLFVVADNAIMWLLADVYERDLLLLREGVPVLFTVDGLPGVSFEGRVNWISSQVDDRTRTVRVRADLPNEDGLLRAKMFGQARLVVHDGANVLSVPSKAVQTDDCCQLVFVREDEAIFVPRKVTLGASARGYVEVLKGLGEGELVATTGSFLMKTEILKGNIGAGCCEVDPGR